MINFIRDWKSQATIDLFSEIMMQDKPLFFGRIGGNEYNAARDRYLNPMVFDNEELYQKTVLNMRNHTGYFDFDNAKVKFLWFLEVLNECYENMEACFFANASLIWPILDGQLPDAPYLNHILEGKTSICYGFMEDTMPFLQSFKKWGEGKKVLIVSPFEESIKFQNERRDKILLDYTFPNFELVAYKTKLLYNTGTQSKEEMGVTTNDWVGELGQMKDEISKLDFDVAWLSCAAYAAPLGDFIAHTLNKKAIYVGGILNMIFNIYGGRYVSYGGVRNPEYTINAFENVEADKLTAGKNCSHEAVCAYFGYMPKG